MHCVWWGLLRQTHYRAETWIYFGLMFLFFNVVFTHFLIFCLFIGRFWVQTWSKSCKILHLHKRWRNGIAGIDVWEGFFHILRMSLPDLQELASTCHDFSWNDAETVKAGPRLSSLEVELSEVLRPSTQHPWTWMNQKKILKTLILQRLLDMPLLLQSQPTKMANPWSYFFLGGWMWSQRNSG